MAEHNELGKLGEEMVEFLRKTDILFWNQLDFSKAEIDIIAQKKIHLLLLSKNSLLRFGLPQICGNL
jgi:hypothetical protein